MGPAPRSYSPFRLAAALAVVTVTAACSGTRDTPEEALAAWLAAAEAAAEAKDRAALLDMISPAYADARGNDRDAIDRRLRLYFLRQASIALLTRVDDIEVQGGTAALMTVTAGMAGTDHGTFGLNADAYRFELELEADDDEWTLIGARWGELGRELR